MIQKLLKKEKTFLAKSLSSQRKAKSFILLLRLKGFLGALCGFA